VGKNGGKRGATASGRGKGKRTALKAEKARGQFSTLPESQAGIDINVQKNKHDTKQ